MTIYPATFPLPKIEGFSATVASGLIKTDMPTQQAQRRVFKTMPHRFSLTFIMSVNTWASWHNWVVTNGYRWFDLELPTMYAGENGTDLSAVLVRFVSDVSVTPISLTDVQITVAAESAPSAMYRQPPTGAETLLGVDRNNYEAVGFALDFLDNSAIKRV